MKWVEITITTAPPAAEAIAHILLESRTGGVAEEHPQPGVVRLRGYLPVGPATDVTLEAIARRIRALPQFGLAAGPAQIDLATVEDTGWASAWKTHFRPFAVGPRLWITPTWEETPAPPGAAVVALDPGMAFGSGLHPSTRLCLEVLAERVHGGERVFDVGTGSGILAIAAAKLGAASVLATDIDPVAVEVAAQNAAHNGVAGVVTVAQTRFLDGATGQADLIVANLTADLHAEFLPTARAHLDAGGLLAASGIVADRLAEVEAAARGGGLVPQQTRRDGEWGLLLAAG